jgi:hypothetical protein
VSNEAVNFRKELRHRRQVYVKKKNMKNYSAADITCSSLILLFSYTAFTKLLSVESFQNTLERAPLIAGGADVVAWAVPLSELAIVLLLFFQFSRLWGLYASLALLTIFTVYLLYMIRFSPSLPCKCGGVISSMSWKQHVIFNLAFIGMTITGIWRVRSGKAEPRFTHTQNFLKSAEHSQR